MKIKIILYVVFLSVSFNLFALPTAKVTIKVVDNDGLPVENAEVDVHFKYYPDRENSDVGETDDDGLFVASGTTIQYVGGCYVTKKDYYPGFCDYTEKDLKSISGIYGFRR